MNSTHAAFVVPVVLEDHPNADSLSVVRIDGFTVCVKTEDWEGIDRAVHITPDSIVDKTRQEFSFLASDKTASNDNKMRVKARKMRGVVSFGFLVPLPADDPAEIGDDLADKLEVGHYDPPIQVGNPNSNNMAAPPGYFTKYDIDNMRKYNRMFKEGELVGVSEKIHGCFWRAVFSSKQDKIYIGSRTNWKAETDLCIWWRAFRLYPQIEQFCRDHPDIILNSECYGQVQNLKYGKTGVDLAAFDIRNPDASWCSVDEFYDLCEHYKIPTAPCLAVNMPFNFDKIVEMSNGKSMVEGATNIREGCVVKPMIERTDDKIGRVILKMVGEDYMLSKKG